MSRLKTLPPRVAALKTRPYFQPQTLSDRRIAGRPLQRRRLAVWSRDPRCAACGRVVAMHEYHLDHIVALVNGGADTDDNCQVLCIPCHKAKTRADLGQAK